MASGTYDIITVGGGLGGAALALAMAEHGARVLVLERERHFRDRVRGEGMHAWGVPEARALGIYERLRETCGVEVRWWDTYLRADRIDHRDFPATTPHHSPLFGFYHPEMQEVLLTAATQAGAEVRRGASVREVQPGGVPSVVLEHEGRVEEAHARLVVGPMAATRWYGHGRASPSSTIPRGACLRGCCWKIAPSPPTRGMRCSTRTEARWSFCVRWAVAVYAPISATPGRASSLPRRRGSPPLGRRVPQDRGGGRDLCRGAGHRAAGHV